MRVAVLMPNEISSWFNAHTFEGIYEVLSREGYDVVPYVMWGDADLERFFHTLPGTQNIDAVFIVSFVLDVAKQRVLSSLTVPVVGINTPSTDGFDARCGLMTSPQCVVWYGCCARSAMKAWHTWSSRCSLPLSYAATRCAWKVSSEQLTIRGTTTGMCW